MARVGHRGRTPSGRRTRRDRARTAVRGRLGPRGLPPLRGRAGPSRSSICSRGSAPRTRRVVVDLGCGEGRAHGVLAAAVARRPGDRRGLLPRDARRGGCDRAGAGGVRRRRRPRLGSRTGRWTWSSATPSCTGSPATTALLADWAGRLRPGGWLAVQVPGNFRAPTHAAAGRALPVARAGRTGWRRWPRGRTPSSSRPATSTS